MQVPVAWHTLPAFRLGDGPSKAPHRQKKQAHKCNPICSIPGEGGAYMPPTTPRSGADDELDTDSVAGGDVAGDVYRERRGGCGRGAHGRGFACEIDTDVYQ